MTSQNTSVEAYFNNVLPTLGDRQRVVYKALNESLNLTNSELAVELDWPINTVTPRVNELRKKNLVVEAGKRICRVTGLRVNSWKVKEIPLPPLFINKYHKVENKMLQTNLTLF